MKQFLFILFFIPTVLELYAQSGTYSNPVVAQSLPDPTVIHADDGYFYLYATEDIRNVPIYRSADLVNWTFQGTAFTDSTRPDFEPGGGIWAPDIHYINGQYVLYYAMSVWGGEQTCGIGVATAQNPQGLFTDRGKLFRSNEIGVQNSIDPFYIEDNGKNYLFWGSFHGIYYVELSDDGLSLKNPDNPQPVQVAGVVFEAACIHKRGNYYYLFASVGSCCDGLNSTYRMVVGRSESATGPYISKVGTDMKLNGWSVFVNSNARFIGNGHCSDIVTDDAGNDWILFHGWDAENPDNGRVLLLNQVKWDSSDWPYVENNSPALTAAIPVFGVSAMKNINSLQIQLQTVENVLVLKSPEPVDVRIFTPYGQLVNSFAQCEQFRAPLIKGIYIVQIKTANKSIVKKICIN